MKEATPMPTYISLLKYTQKGIENIKDGPKRLEAARELFKKLGGELKQFYLVMGQYDAVSIGEAPNEEVVTKAVLAIASKGNVQTTTFRAFTEEEYRKIISDLP
jgi:uncharacterized protein with GYD domain